MPKPPRLQLPWMQDLQRELRVLCPGCPCSRPAMYLATCEGNFDQSFDLCEQRSSWRLSVEF